MSVLTQTAEYDHELDLVVTVHMEMRMSRAKNAGEKRYKQYLRNLASGYASRIEVREFVFKRDGYRCVYCGAKEDLQIDHIISVYRGGKNKICNLQTLCGSCNAAKAP